MAVYNLSGLDNATSIVDITHTLTNVIGWDFLIGNLIIVAFSLVFFTLAAKLDITLTLVIDGFLSTILATLLYAAGMVAAPTIIYPAVLFFIALIVHFLK